MINYNAAVLSHCAGDCQTEMMVFQSGCIDLDLGHLVKANMALVGVKTSSTTLDTLETLLR